MMKRILAVVFGAALAALSFGQTYLPTGQLFGGAVQTSAPTITTAACGNVVAAGGSAFYSLTVGAASGFPAGCTITFANTDTGRAKAMAVNGVTWPNGGFLWPLQTSAIVNVANAWVIANSPGRWALAADVTFFVDPVSGADTNDCLASGAGACLTIAKAISNYACNAIDAQGHKPIIQLADDTTHYTTQVNLCPVHGTVNAGFTTVPVLRGNVATPANVRMNVTSGNDITAVNVGHAWRVEGIDFRITTGGTAIVADVFSKIYIGVNSFNVGACCNVFGAQNGGFIEWVSNFTIAGPANAVINNAMGGKTVSQAITVTITGTPAWAFAFANLITGGDALLTGVTFSGASTGNRCSISTGGGIDTGGSGATFLPGNVACSGGSVVNPGWYNFLLKRDLDPANDNTPMWLEKVG